MSLVDIGHYTVGRSLCTAVIRHRMVITDLHRSFSGCSYNTMSADVASLPGSKRNATDAQLETADDEVDVKTDSTEIQAMPLKRFFRSRAHCNPLSHNDGFHYPLSPEAAGTA